MMALMSYDPHTALIVVDVQNDFADPNGSLYVSGAQEIVPVVNDEIKKAAEAGAFLVYTQDWHPASTPHFEKDGGIWPVHCVQETWGAQFHPDLEVKGEIVQKGSDGQDGYSGFNVRDPQTGVTEQTPLEDSLRRQGMHRVVVVGLATDYCVKETAMDAAAKGFETVVVQEAVRPVNLQPQDGEHALATMSAAGVAIV